MLIKVRVKDSGMLGGYAHNGSRLRIIPGNYDVDKTDDDVLIFKQANESDAGDLVVKKDEYLELKNFPDITRNPYIEIIE